MAEKLKKTEILKIGEECIRLLGCIPKAVRLSLSESALAKTRLILLAMEGLGEIPLDQPKQHSEKVLENVSLIIKGFAEGAAEDELQRKSPDLKAVKIEFKNVSEAYRYYKKNLVEERPALLSALKRIHGIMENRGVEKPLSKDKRELAKKQMESLEELISKKFPLVTDAEVRRDSFSNRPHRI